MSATGRIRESLQGAIDWLYLPPFRRVISRQLFGYLLCGGGNYIVLDALLYYLIYHHVVGERYINLCGEVVIAPHTASLIILFPITFLTGFWLNRNVAFDSTKREVTPQIMRYGVSVVGSLLVSYITLKLLVEQVGVWATPAKVISSTTTAIYSYLMARLYTFKQ